MTIQNIYQRTSLYFRLKSIKGFVLRVEDFIGGKMKFVELDDDYLTDLRIYLKKILLITHLRAELSRHSLKPFISVQLTSFHHLILWYDNQCDEDLNYLFQSQIIIAGSGASLPCHIDSFIDRKILSVPLKFPNYNNDDQSEGCHFVVTADRKTCFDLIEEHHAHKYIYTIVTKIVYDKEAFPQEIINKISALYILNSSMESTDELNNISNSYSSKVHICLTKNAVLRQLQLELADLYSRKAKLLYRNNSYQIWSENLRHAANILAPNNHFREVFSTHVDPPEPSFYDPYEDGLTSERLGEPVAEFTYNTSAWL